MTGPEMVEHFVQRLGLAGQLLGGAGALLGAGGGVLGYLVDLGQAFLNLFDGAALFLRGLGNLGYQIGGFGNGFHNAVKG